MISSAASALHDMHLTAPSYSSIGVEEEGKIEQEGRGRRERESKSWRKESGRGKGREERIRERGRERGRGRRRCREERKRGELLYLQLERAFPSAQCLPMYWHHSCTCMTK